MGAPYISCAGKVGFVTFALAQRAANRTRKSKHTRTHAYHCHYCDLYHTGGSMPARAFKRPRTTELGIDD